MLKKTFASNVSYIVIAVVLLLMIAVWPVGIIANVDTVSSESTGKSYVNTEEVIEPGEYASQTFVAKGWYLAAISFDVMFYDYADLSNGLEFSLLDSRGKEIFSKHISGEEFKCNSYTEVVVSKVLMRGSKYEYRIYNNDNPGAIFLKCTSEPQDAFPGSKATTINGHDLSNEYSWVSSFLYRLPLRMNGVFVIWSLLLTLLVVYFYLARKLFKVDKIFSNQKIETAISSIDKFINKYHYFVLIVETVIISVLIINMCRNIAVDWDESFTYNLISNMSFKEMMDAIVADVHPPLYYWFVRLVSLVFPNNIVAYKMVSVFFGIATMVLGILFVDKRFGVKAASFYIYAAGMAPQLLWYIVDVRMYSQMVFFVCAAFFMAYEIIEDDKLYAWILFVVFSLGGVYTQYYALFPLALIYVGLFVYCLITKKNVVKFFMASFATVVGYLPWLKNAFNLVGGAEGVVANTSWDNLGIKYLLEYVFPSDCIITLGVALALIVISIVVLVVQWKSYTNKQRMFVCTAGVMLWFTFAICMYIASHVNHFWDYRYLLPSIMIFWLYMSIVFSKDILLWILGVILLISMSIPNYEYVYRREMGTVEYIKETQENFSVMGDDTEFLYNLETFDTFFEYYFPGKEAIWYLDYEFDDSDQEVYLIVRGPDFFPQEMIDEHGITSEHIADGRLEEGIFVGLYKIRYER